MSLSFIGPGGTFEESWLRYALLRDNVLHHLDHGSCSNAFSALYAVAESLGGKRVAVSAAKLSAEVEAIQAQVLLKPVTELAISARTKGVLDRSWPPGPLTTSILGSANGLPDLPSRVANLGDIFGLLVEALSVLARPKSDGDVVEIIDT